jgi:nucleoside-diphosphate-sugar epimerase
MSSSRTARVVVTGAGSSTATSSIAPQVEVVVLANLSRGQLSNIARDSTEPRRELIHGDIRDPDVVATAIFGASVAYHLAAQSTVMGGVTDAEYTFTTNLVGTFNVPRAAARLGFSRLCLGLFARGVRRAIDLPVDEESPLLAINSYSASTLPAKLIAARFDANSASKRPFCDWPMCMAHATWGG